MKKLFDLRDHMQTHVPALKKNPDRLDLWIGEGDIECRAGGNLSFEYRYKASMLVKDHAEHADVLMVPLLAWISVNQPDLLQAGAQTGGIKFEAEILDHGKADVLIVLQLSERVVVTANAGGGYTATHCDEPPLPDLGGPVDWMIYINGMPIA